MGRRRFLPGLMVVGVWVVLTGCSVPPLQDSKKLDAMVGQSSVALIRQFGVPSRSYQAQDHLFLAYEQTDTSYSPGSAGWGWGWGGYGYGYGWGNLAWSGGTPPSVYTSTCQTTFELVGDVVKGWTLKGDGC